jgi:hypothetical protein
LLRALGLVRYPLIIAQCQGSVEEDERSCDCHIGRGCHGSVHTSSDGN